MTCPRLSTVTAAFFVIVIAQVLLAHAVSESDVKFWLYTRQNKADDRRQELSLTDATLLDNSNFDGQKDTKFIVHGWFGGTTRFKSPWMRSIKDAFLDLLDVNIIIVDWGKLAGNPFYIKPAKNTRFVGQLVARMIEFLEVQTNTTRKSMHLIGHSLGGQVSGFAGKNLDPKPGRISGLDTASFSFDDQDAGDTLDATDADFVDEIHTLVSYVDRGHADFYPNGGSDDVPIKIWEHLQAPRLYIASIQSGKCAYKSYVCSDYDQFKDQGCRKSDGNRMGYYAYKPPKHTKYFLDANTKQPCDN